MALNSPLLWLGFIATLVQAGVALAQTPQSWVVELGGDKTNNAYESMKDAVVSRLLEGNYTFNISHEYSSGVFTGLSLTCAPDCYADLCKVTSVKSVWAPGIFHQLGLDHTSEPPFQGDDAGHDAAETGAADEEYHLNDVHLMTRVNLLHERNLTGKGVRVAIIDGGVDYLHPALGQGFGDGHQVQYGWDFVGDNVKPPNKEQPDDDPYGDCSNHATHTAGILFAQDVEGKTGFRGVAPGVTVEHYRVFDCNGMSTGDVVVRAVLRAYERGVDLINLSLGSGSKPFSDGIYPDPLSSLVARINREGKTFIVVVSGNNGHAGTFGAAAPEGGGDDMFAVGSVDAPYLYSVYRPATLYVDGIPTKNLTYNPETWTAHRRSEFPSRISLLSLDDDFAAEASGCSEIKDKGQGLKDAAVLLRRGRCTLKTKMENLVRAGVKYALIYNNVPGPAFDLEVRLDDGLEIHGAASLTLEVGEELVALISSGHKVELEMDSNFTRLPVFKSSLNSKTAAKVSVFTSWGPSGEGRFITSVLAPGGGILSTFPRRNGGWGIQSGASMAVPYLVGVLTLLKEAFPTVPTKRIADTLSNTARPVEFNDGTNKTFGFLSSPWQQGSGLVDAWGAFVALQTGVTTDVTKLAFNDTEYGKRVLKFRLHNSGGNHIEYNVSVVPGASVLSLDGITQAPVPFAAAVRAPEASPEFLKTLPPEEQVSVFTSITRVTLAPGEEATVDVSVNTTVLEPMKHLCPLFGGWVKLTSSFAGESHDLSIPYGGIACNIKDIPTLNKNYTYLSSATRGEVEMARFWNRRLKRLDEGQTFTLSRNQPPFDDQNPDEHRFNNEQLPVVQVQLNMDTRGIQAELLPAGGGTPTEVFPREVGSRKGGWGRVETVHLIWDGRLPNGSWADAGDYAVRIRTLRLFGDELAEGDWRDEVLTSTFRLEYKDGSQQKSKQGIAQDQGITMLIPCY